LKSVLRSSTQVHTLQAGPVHQSISISLAEGYRQSQTTSLFGAARFPGASPWAAPSRGGWGWCRQRAERGARLPSSCNTNRERRILRSPRPRPAITPGRAEAQRRVGGRRAL